MSGSYFYGFHIHGQPIEDNLVGFGKEWSKTVPRASWTGPSKLHVTLKFVGKTQPETESFLQLCVKTKPFKLNVKGLGTFNNRSGPRVLFARLEPFTLLSVLHGNLGGHPETFTPHLTLAKLEDIGDAEPEFANIAQRNTNLDFGSCLVDELRLYQTQGEGRPYRVVAWHRLLG